MLKIKNSSKIAQVEVGGLVGGLDEPQRGGIGLAHGSRRLSLVFAITISV